MAATQALKDNPFYFLNSSLALVSVGSLFTYLLTIFILTGVLWGYLRNTLSDTPERITSAFDISYNKHSILLTILRGKNKFYHAPKLLKYMGVSLDFRRLD